jgi:hypothetical protein
MSYLNITPIIFSGGFDQSNGRGATLTSSIPNSGIYAPFNALSTSYQLKGDSSNSVKTYANNSLEELTLENYAINTSIFTTYDYTEKNTRDLNTFGWWLTAIDKIREEMDLEGNNGDLLAYCTSIGGIQAVQNSALDLSVNSGEHFRFTMESFIRDILEDSTIVNPLPILSWCHGESDNPDPTNLEIEYNLMIADVKARFGNVPIIVMPPAWDRTNSIGVLNTIISENDNIYSVFGADMEAAIAETVSRHNATGVGTTMDSTDTATFTDDGVHFNYAVNFHYGEMFQEKLKAIIGDYNYGEYVAPVAPASAPNNLTVVDGVEELTVSFDSVNNTNSYVIQYKLSTDSTYTDIVTTSTSVVISSLTGSVSYDVRVVSRNLVGDSSPSAVVTGTPTSSSPVVREVGADIHHFFGTDYSTYEDIQGGGALTLINTAPTNGTGETTTAAGINGLESAVSMDRNSQTVVMVVKIDNAAGLPGSFVGGNITSTSSNGGFGFYEYAGDVAAQFRGTAAGGVLTSTPDFTNYVFLAVTMDSFDHYAYYQDSNGQRVYNYHNGSITVSANPLGIGNTYTTNSNFQLGTSVAEFIVFDHPKTEAELDDIYARSVTRLAARGITV